MRTLFKWIICLFLLILLHSCDFMTFVLGLEPNVIWLKNNADYSIGWYVADGALYGNFYPDSLPDTDNQVYHRIEPKEDRVIIINPCSTWKRFFNWLPYDTLSVFIFHSDTLEKYTWEEVRDGYKIIKRYDLSLDDIEHMDYTIVYP